MPYPINKGKKPSALEPFSVRSFCFSGQPICGLLGVRDEALIMGWYILAQTNSVVMLTLVVPFGFWVNFCLLVWRGGRPIWPARRCFHVGRANGAGCHHYGLALTDILLPIHVLTVAFIVLIQPSDILMRNALVGDTIPQPMIWGAISISEQLTTQRVSSEL